MIFELCGHSYIFMNDWNKKENVKIGSKKGFLTLAQILVLQWTFFLNKMFIWKDVSLNDKTKTETEKSESQWQDRDWKNLSLWNETG